MSFTVQVLRGDDSPARGVRVKLSFTDFTRGMTDAVRTDEDGEADFDGYEDGEVKVFLNGDDYGTYSYEDGASITLSIGGASDDSDDD